MSYKQSKIVVIAQNIFIAVMLGRLSTRCITSNDKTILVPSRFEKFILQILFKDKRNSFTFIAIDDFIKPSKIALAEIPTDSVEYRRRSVSLRRLMELDTGLRLYLKTLVNTTPDSDLQIWIYNKWTWIGRCLAKHPNLPSCLVFESANYKKAICVVSDLSNDTAEDARSDFLNRMTPISEKKSTIEVAKIRKVRVPALIISILNRGGWKFYTTRLLARTFNIVVFKAIAKFQNQDYSEPIVLAVLQIEQDSEILRHGSAKEYRNTLTDMLCTKENQNLVVLRPHPNDFTFGWMKIYFHLKLNGVRTRFSFGNVENIQFNKVSHVYTYSSNFLRLIPNSFDQKKISAIKNLPELINVNAEKISVYKGIL